MFIVTVPAHTGENHVVRRVADQIICSCHDHVYRSKGEPYVCKHIAQVVAELATFATTATQSKAAKQVLGTV